MNEVRILAGSPIPQPRGDAPSAQPLLTRIRRDQARALNGLIRLEHDTTDALMMALRRANRLDLRCCLHLLLERQHEQLRELMRCVELLGERPVAHSDYLSLVERARVLIGGLQGDRGLVAAMQRNYELLVRSYDEVVQRPGFDEQSRDVLQRGHGAAQGALDAIAGLQYSLDAPSC
jgi:hypothetical protein